VSAVWLTIILVAVASATIKAAGPLLLGDRQLGPRATAVIALLGPALLTALVLVDTITAGQRLVVDARWPAWSRRGSRCCCARRCCWCWPWRLPPPRWCACWPPRDRRPLLQEIAPMLARDLRSPLLARRSL
jgi:hypothetical protein